MINIRLTLQYDGTRYLGWQRPEKDRSGKTISCKLSSVLEKLKAEGFTAKKEGFYTVCFRE